MNPRLLIPLALIHLLAAMPGLAQQPSPPPGATAGSSSSADRYGRLQSAYGNPGPPAGVRPIENGEILARIGGEVVLAGEILPAVNEMLERHKDKISPEEVEPARRMLLERNLSQLIDTKVLYGAARREIPAEHFKDVEKKLIEQFEKSELPKLYESTKTGSRAELDAKLRLLGSSLAQQQRMFSERMLASQWLRQHVKFDEEITHDQMLAYYREHEEEYAFEAKARWEEIMVRFDRFASKADAYRELAQLGNHLWRGAPLADVARAHSHGVTAHDGGQYDWTTRGSLVSQQINHALFTLAVGQLSPIIESETGFHILRVVERRDAGRTPFVEAQVEIRKHISRENTQRQIKEYLGRLREQTRVWTIFDADPSALPHRS